MLGHIKYGGTGPVIPVLLRVLTVRVRNSRSFSASMSIETNLRFVKHFRALRITLEKGALEKSLLKRLAT